MEETLQTVEYVESRLSTIPGNVLVRLEWDEDEGTYEVIWQADDCDEGAPLATFGSEEDAIVYARQYALRLGSTLSFETGGRFETVAAALANALALRSPECWSDIEVLLKDSLSGSEKFELAAAAMDCLSPNCAVALANDILSRHQTVNEQDDHHPVPEWMRGGK